MITVFRCGGEVQVEHRQSLTWSDLQREVAGFVEVVPLGPQRVLAVNEDGLRNHLPPNKVASTILGRPIVGNVVLLEGEDVDRVLDGRDDPDVA